MIYNLRHKTTYRYSDPVSICHNRLHLTPRATLFQRFESSEMKISPRPAVLNHRVDYFGNKVTYFTIQEPHRRLVVEVASVVDVATPPTLPPMSTMPWERVRELLRHERSPDILAAYQFAFDSPYIPLGIDLAAFAERAFTPGRPVLDAAVALMGIIHAEFEYVPKATTISTPIREVMRIRKGVCQDFAHLMIGCLRSLGLASRYTSGYLLTAPPPGQKKLVGSDESHAWLSIFCPGAGWIELDPTNNKIPGGEHITLAWGRDYGDVTPMNGVLLGGGHQALSVAVDVTPINNERG